MMLTLNFISYQILALFSLFVSLIYLLWSLQTAVFNVWSHKLSAFPGPRLAAASAYYRAWIECVFQISWHDHLHWLHAQYGPVVRIGPNELHFSDPQAYHDIHNNSIRWDKDEVVYRSFGQDESSFSLLTYKDSKERKDVLNKSFSTRAILEAQHIVQDKIDQLCRVFDSLAQNDQPANLSYAFRCMTMDVITAYCFGTSVSAIQAPGFHSPIIVAMDAAMPVFVWFKHSSLYKNMILKCPRPLSRLISPSTSGLVDLQEILEKQIEGVISRPETLDNLPHRQTIYHSLLNRSNYKNIAAIPSAHALYDEAQGLMFGGADTVGNTLMTLAFHISQPRNHTILTKLQTELREIYPNPSSSPLSVSTLERLPYLNAVIKESLRLNSGLISGLPRVVPSTGAIIANTQIPPATVVSIGSTFVHHNAQIFPEPHRFDPERWLPTADQELLDHNLVPFSRGPRACVGINLAWAELRLATATVFRRFEMELDPSSPAELRYRDAFLPEFVGADVLVRLKKLS